jgi:pimeloyl-ACP methyl ester carboxylesterase
MSKLIDPPDAIRSFDETFVAGRLLGEGDDLPLLVCNPVGAGMRVWRRALLDVQRDRRVVGWDLRGLLESPPPASHGLDATFHSRDAVAVLDYYGIERCAIVSWSNGGRIALQIAYEEPERVAGLVMVSGGYGHPLWRLIRHLELPSVLPVIARFGKYFAAPLERGFRTIVARPEIAGLVRQSGMIGPTADIEALVDLLQDLASCDLRRLLATYEAIAGDARPELFADIQAPTMLVVGSEDQFMSRGVVAEMNQSLPRSITEVYEGATHYLPLEYPSRLSDDLRKFLASL